jgi:hypothetical protein
MKLKELRKMNVPVDPEKAMIEVAYEPSEDGKRVTLKFKSDTPMSAFDFSLALIDFVNDFVAMTYKDRKN